MPGDVLNLIDGRLTPARGGATLPNIDPATGGLIGTLPASQREDVDDAVSAASRAAPGWGARPARERASILRRLAALIERDLEPLALAECVDTGKPLSLARAMDIPRAAANFRFFADQCEREREETYRTEAPMPSPGGGASNVAAVNRVLRPALGVVGLISPWNLPLYLLSWKIAPALAWGNAAVCKPSELTPTTAFMLSRLAMEAGVPAGVLNIVHGLGAACGAALVAHPGVKAVSFTGGTATGASIAASAAPMFKKISLELGGKNATIVLDDADVEWAAAQAARAGFSNQGQICLCGSRVLVHRRIAPAFTRAFVEHASALTCGDPLDPATRQGALISEAHLKKVVSYVRLAEAEGGRVLCGGERPRAGELPARCAGGFYFKPTVVAGLGPGARVQREEVFGPLVTVSEFEDDDDAVRLANDSGYGLAASVWGADAARATRVAERLEVGTAWVNCWLLRDLRVPFGGLKNSGVGREGGDEAMRFFTEARVVCTAGA